MDNTTHQFVHMLSMLEDLAREDPEIRDFLVDIVEKTAPVKSNHTLFNGRIKVISDDPNALDVPTPKSSREYRDKRDSKSILRKCSQCDRQEYVVVGSQEDIPNYLCNRCIKG